jgi:hypothetical protein
VLKKKETLKNLKIKSLMKQKKWIDANPDHEDENINLPQHK